MDKQGIEIMMEMQSEGARILYRKMNEEYARLVFGFWCFLAFVASTQFAASGGAFSFLCTLVCPWVGFSAFWAITHAGYANG